MPGPTDRPVLRCYSQEVVSAVAIRPPRTRTVIAVAAVLYLLGHTIAQCGLFLAHDHDTDVHVVTTSTAVAAEEHAPGHAHIEQGEHRPHEGHTVVAMPRSDNPLRPLGTAVVLALVALVVMMALMPATLAARAPPDPIPRARSGRTILNTLCINRC